MLKAKCAVIERGHHPTLEEIGKDIFKLREIQGEINFCETRPEGDLRIEIKGHEEEIWWGSQSTRPMPALCGMILRGFYENMSPSGKEIHLEAYELLNKKGQVLTRDPGAYRIVF